MNGFKVDFFLTHTLHYPKIYYLLLSRRRGIFVHDVTQGTWNCSTY